MPGLTQRKRTSTTHKLGELAFAAPQVVAHRMTRMALAGPVLSARDQKEFSGMLEEKQEAFAASCMAMWGEAARIQMSLATAWLNPIAALSPWSLLELATQAARLQGPAQRVAGKGLAPYHQKTMANAKRLAKTKLR